MTTTSYQKTSPHKESTIAVRPALRMTKDILWNMETKLVTAVKLLDLSAAFNTVDHDILLEVLHNNFGIERNVLKWYNNYV